MRRYLFAHVMYNACSRSLSSFIPILTRRLGCLSLSSGLSRNPFYILGTISPSGKCLVVFPFLRARIIAG